MAKGNGKGGKTTAPKTGVDPNFVEGQDPGVAATKAAAQGATDADTPVVRKDVVPTEYRERYQANGGNNGDFIANELSVVTKDGGLPVLNTIKAENNILPNRWAGFNNGMIRMNIANVLRASFLRGETIKIAGKEFSVAKMLEDYGKPVDYNNETEVGRFVKFMGLLDTERNRKAIARTLAPKRDIEAERAAKKAEREKAAAEKAAQREAAAAEKKAERDKAAAEKAAQREAAAAEKAAEREKAKAAREAERTAAREKAAAAKAPATAEA